MTCTLTGGTAAPPHVPSGGMTVPPLHLEVGGGTPVRFPSSFYTESTPGKMHANGGIINGGVLHVSVQNSREGDPPKKPPTQIKTVCTNSLRKLFCLFSAYLKGEKRDSLHKLSRNCLRKLFVQTVFIWVGGFLGGSSLHEKWRFFAHFCAFWRFFVPIFVPKWPAEKRCYAIPPLVIPPFACH